MTAAARWSLNHRGAKKALLEMIMSSATPCVWFAYYILPHVLLRMLAQVLQVGEGGRHITRAATGRGAGVAAAGIFDLMGSSVIVRIGMAAA